MSDKNELTPAERELETALRSLRPTPARIGPAAAVVAAGRSTSPGRLRYWHVAAAAAASIAVVGGAWLALGPRGDMPIDPPTVMAYRRALAQSPAELNNLLDRQATTGLAADDHCAPVGVSTLWNADLQTSLGEM
jgi:hypothetical protein